MKMCHNYQKCPMCEGCVMNNDISCDCYIIEKTPNTINNKIDYIINIDGDEYISNMMKYGELLINNVSEHDYLKFKMKSDKLFKSHDGQMPMKKDCVESYNYRTFFETGQFLNCLTVVSLIEKSVVVLYDHKIVNPI